MKKKLWMLLFFVIGMPSLLWAQAVVSGHVKDADTKKALPFSTVFIANSTFGAVTDDDGNFSIAINTGGQFNLVVSFMGYKTFETTFEVKVDSTLTLEISLQPLVMDLTERVVTDKRDKSWYKNLKTFEEYFLGNSINGKKAKIQNPNVLIMDDQSKQDYLIVTANEPVLIENPNLGYMIRFVLVSFELNTKTKELAQFGYPFFEELELSARRRNRVEKNRKRAFEGSLIHFFQTLSNNELKDSDFMIYLVKNQNQPYVANSEIISKEITNVSDLLVQESDGRRFLQSKDPLLVIFNGEPEEIGYSTRLGVSQNFFQTSKLTLRTKRIRITEEGLYFPSRGIFLEGYMAWEAVGDLMPWGYQP